MAVPDIPVVNVDGSVCQANPAAYAGGEIAAVLHGGGNLLYGRSGDDALAACTPLPARLLLGYTLQTRRDRRMGALATAIVHAMIAMLPALVALKLFSTLGDGKRIPLFAALTIIVGAAARAFWIEMRAPGKVWELSKWIDFEERCWHARRRYTDDSLPLEVTSFPLDSLALLCYVQHWENGVSHDVGLCQRAELGNGSQKEPAFLNQVHSSATKEAAHAFARALAALWGIECWQRSEATHPQLRRLS